MGQNTGALHGIKCVIFDLDGTLVDTAPDLLDTLNVIFGRMGRRPIHLHEIRRIIGRGARHMLRMGSELTGDALDEKSVETLFQAYLSHYEQNMSNKSRPFEGAVEVLDNLKARSIPMAVCTNKLEKLSVRLLENLGLYHYFVAVIGGDTLSVMKPNPRTIHAILEPLRIDPRDSLFVGDSETDLKTARAAGTSVALVDYGYTPCSAASLKPDYTLASLRDLL